MRHLCLLGILFFEINSFASKCIAPDKDWWNPSLRPTAAHFQFTFAWDNPENLNAQITFRDSKSGKNVVVVSPAGVFIHGNKVCGYAGFSLSGCPADLPVKCEDENLFRVEFSGMQNQKLTMPYRGQKLEASLPDGLECTLLPAEANQKELIAKTVKSDNLGSFLTAAQACVTAKNKKCRSRFFAPDVVEQLKDTTHAEDLAPLILLLKQRAYPHVLHVTEATPGEVCNEEKPSPHRVRIALDTCEVLTLNKENSSWRITQYSGN